MNRIEPDRLAQLAADALERTAFVVVDTADPDAADDFAPTHRSTLVLTADAWTGTVALAADDDFLREVASSLLGIDEDEVDIGEHGVDVLRELANIIAGSVSLELGGDRTTIQMGLPRILEPDAEAPTPDSGTLLAGESGHFAISWSIQEASKAAA